MYSSLFSPFLREPSQVNVPTRWCMIQQGRARARADVRGKESRTSRTYGPRGKVGEGKGQRKTRRKMEVRIGEYDEGWCHINISGFHFRRLSIRLPVRSNPWKGCVLPFYGHEEEEEEGGMPAEWRPFGMGALCLARVASYLHFKRLHPSASAVAVAAATTANVAVDSARCRKTIFRGYRAVVSRI